jgi:hypothetical protein
VQVAGLEHAAGIYFCRLESGDKGVGRKVVLAE